MPRGYKPASFLVLAAAMIVSPAAAACDGPLLKRLMDAPLPERASDTIDVMEQQSAEGGTWEIHIDETSGKPRYLVRTDFGETGRQQTRLTIAAPDSFAIARIRFIYSAPIYIAGSDVIRQETDFYVYCDGKLALPSPEDAGDRPDYRRAADEAWKTFEAGEISIHVAGLKRPKS